MEFKQLLMERYATKKFDGQKVDNEIIEEIMEMTRFAPSALNIQPWKIKVIADDELKRKLSPASMDQPQITTCSHLLVFCANTDMKGNAEKIVKGMENAGVPEENLNLFKGVLDRFLSIFDEESMIGEAQKNVFLAALTAIFAAKSLGVDSCPMQGFDPVSYSEILELPPNLVPTIIVPLGFPADIPMPKTRFPKEDIFF